MHVARRVIILLSVTSIVGAVAVLAVRRVQLVRCSLSPRLQAGPGGLIFMIMKKRTAKTAKKIEQPRPFTPGVTKADVRQHAYEMFRDKLPDHPLTLDDWVMAEKDLVRTMETENL